MSFVSPFWRKKQMDPRSTPVVVVVVVVADIGGLINSLTGSG